MPVAERTVFIERRCGGDAAMRTRVEKIVDEHASATLSDQPTQAFSSGAGSQPLTSRDDLGEAVGDMVGRYKLVEKIAEGGFGAVYVAEQREPVVRQVALKIIKLGMDTKQVVARFDLERQALAMMEHPNIAKVYDAGAMENGRPFFVMELVRGTRITDYCDENNLSTEARLDLFLKTCHAIQHAHQKGIIHRDIKPSNILVVAHEGVATPKVIDFGIAKATDESASGHEVHTQFQQLIGTPAYMSPEQTRMTSRDIDTRTDVYSLGVLLYELLTGTTPLEQEELQHAGIEQLGKLVREKEAPAPSKRLTTMEDAKLSDLAARRGADPPRLIQSLRGDLDWIVMKCLEKDRERRYEAVSELALDVQRCLDHEPVFARPQTRIYRLQKLVRRHRIAAIGAVAVALSLVAGVAVSTWQAVRATRAERLAEGARREAENSAIRTRETLAASDLLQAMRLISENNRNDALAYLARGLSLNSNNFPALTRLATLLAFHSWRLPILTLKGNQPLSAAHFSPDGSRILALWENGTLSQWKAADGSPLSESIKISGHPLAFSRGGWVVTDSSDKTARIWNAQSNPPMVETPPHIGPVLAAAISADETRIATVAADQTGRGFARIWDVRNGQPLTSPLNLGIGSALLAAPPGPGMNAVQFNSDGTQIVTAWQNLARVWNAQTGLPMAEPISHLAQVQSARFSPDGTRIVTASLDGTAREFNSQTGRPMGDLMKFSEGMESGSAASHGRSINEVSAEFSPAGERIVTLFREGTFQIWNAQSEKPMTEPRRTGARIQSLSFSKDGRWLVTALGDGFARLWDARNGQPLAEGLKQDAPISWAEFSPDGSQILTASADKTAHIWPLAGAPLLPEPAPESAATAVTNPAQTRGLPESVSQHGPFSSVNYSSDARRILTGATNGLAQIWDAQTGESLAVPMQHEGPVFDAQFSPDGGLVVTAAADKIGRADLRFWDAQTGQTLSEPIVSSERTRESAPPAIRFDADGRRVAMGDEVWDVPPQTSAPQWLPQLAVAFAGEFVNDRGILEPIHTNPVVMLTALRRELDASTNHSAWTIWGRWLLADPFTRNISPYSRIKLADYVERRIADGDPDSFDASEWLAAGDPALLERVTAARAAVGVESEAETLAGQDRFSEAENRFREALALDQKAFPDRPRRVEGAVGGLADCLVREGKIGEIARLFESVLPKSNPVRPAQAGLLFQRGWFLARTGQWKDAAADFQTLVHLEPDNAQNYHALETVALQTGDYETFHSQCAAALAQCSQTKDPVAVSQLAKDCLILLPAPKELTAGQKLAEIATAAGPKHRLFATFALTRALAAYRAGDFPDAIDWARKARSQSASAPAVEAQADMVLAMAWFQSSQSDQARAAFSGGSEIIEKQGQRRADDRGADWIEWVDARVLAGEASGMFGSRLRAARP